MSNTPFRCAWETKVGANKKRCASQCAHCMAVAQPNQEKETLEKRAL